MYSRDQAKQLKEKFWTTFGQYMAVIPSADFEKVNWVNYKTGVKYVFFRMDATNRKASCAIEISHPDSSIRQLIYNQFEELKDILESSLVEEWVWMASHFDEHGREISCIFIEIQDVSVFRSEDWPTLISFFKPRIIALDNFWTTAKYSFDIFK